MHKQKAPEKVCTLLQTLAEMSRLLYLGESERKEATKRRLHFELIELIKSHPQGISPEENSMVYIYMP